jgi:hypothetical protein
MESPSSRFRLTISQEAIFHSKIKGSLIKCCVEEKPWCVCVCGGSGGGGGGGGGRGAGERRMRMRRSRGQFFELT